MTEEKITLSKKNRIVQLCSKYENCSSSHAFPSLYIWRKSIASRLYLGEEMFTLKCDSKGENAWFFPCGDDEEKVEFIREKMKEKDFSLCYIREKDLGFFQEYFPEQFLLEERPEDSEYIYDRELWERLEGKKYAGLRNHIRRAMRDNELSVKTISENDIENVYQIISEWDKGKRAEGMQGDSDEMPSMELIKNYKELSVFGIIVYVNEEPYAVVAGFPLSEQMFDMCLAKQKSTLSGLSVYAKHQLVSMLDKKYKYINAEEDLGIEGLRMMKKQMQPIGQIKMFDGRVLKNE